jgi:hypothetical protein
MEMQQTHYYTTGTATLPWKCNMVHRSCYQGKPNMSQYEQGPVAHEVSSMSPSRKTRTNLRTLPTIYTVKHTKNLFFVHSVDTRKHKTLPANVTDMSKA